ncbi:MAG: site-2 protease family protein [Acidocella sp. 20-57-95]|nr:MAG: site-2 protease family protein [Acidocella sp. 20-57-95]OYV59218.1 MAG: site-2 protease family protein [Acidocella sp. 21-58-7]HQT64621.1 site-2 protease family protein [Acidocella sp.]HQU04578.1 site-2 protease family protein [Acidocella sp.]
MVTEAISGILATLIAIILHELAHGLAAWALGDKTAKLAGRLTLNPLNHIDPIGTVFLPIFLVVSQLATIGRVAFMFGWAKPVPVNPMALHIGGTYNPRRMMAMVAIAGPLMNFALAIIGAQLFFTGFAPDFFLYFIAVNLVLGLFNLLPLPPMDGGRVAVGLLPLPAAKWLAGMEKYGIFAVLLVLFVLPTLLGQAGIHFDPFNDALNAALPWATNLVFQMTGHTNGF